MTTQQRQIAIKFGYDDWAMIAAAVAEHATKERLPYELRLSAVIDRMIGNSAIAGCSEAEADRTEQAPAG